VHLQDWPRPAEQALDEELERRMALVRRLVDLGRTARGESSVGTRQPLATALVAAPGWDELPLELRQLVADELNVQSVASLAEAADELVEVSVKPNFRALGQRFGKATAGVAEAIRELDAEGLVAQLRAPDPGASIHVHGMGEPVLITEADVIVTETPREGWAVASEGGATVALDLHLTPELVSLGVARQMIRVVQEARKSSGFEVSDRIELTWAATDPTVTSAIAQHTPVIAEEVLATSVGQGSVEDSEGFAPKDGSFRVWVRRPG
jgi:isoleucyl-tRNA synthetase